MTCLVLLITAERDLLQPDVWKLAEVLIDHGVTVEVDDVPGLWHAYQQQAAMPEAQASMERVVAFVAAALDAAEADLCAGWSRRSRCPRRRR